MMSASQSDTLYLAGSMSLWPDKLQYLLLESPSLICSEIQKYISPFRHHLNTERRLLIGQKFSLRTRILRAFFCQRKRTKSQIDHSETEQTTLLFTRIQRYSKMRNVIFEKRYLIETSLKNESANKGTTPVNQTFIEISWFIV